jgi:hypothetical protein
MSFSLPEFLPSALPSDDETREMLTHFQALISFYENGFKTSLRFRPKMKAEFPAILSTWLLSALQRSRIVAWGVIQSVNAGNAVIAVLAVRALLENAAYVCYARDGLQRTYAQKLSRMEMTMLAFRLRFSQRHNEKGCELTADEMERVKAVNILTVLGHLDRYFSNKFHGETRANVFTNWYGRLCEFSHPNGLGIEIGTEQRVADNYFSYEREPGICEEVLGVIAAPVFTAQYSLFELYNECWSLMIENGEQLPAMVPDSDPRIVVD